ncbi:MAG: peptidoglycan-binding domain-containing protein [Clostridia bacterium]|nr:peptidoglycan-binding domain-containing protein [Clostridia bacterium]
MEEQNAKSSTEDLLEEITKEAINIGYIEPENVPPGYDTAQPTSNSPLPEPDSSDEVAATAEGELTEDLINQALNEIPPEQPTETGQSQWRNRLLALKDRLDQTLHQENPHLAKPVNHLKSMAESAAIDRKALVIYIGKLAVGGMALGLIAGIAIFGLPRLFTPEPPPIPNKVAPSIAKEEKQAAVKPENKKQPPKKEAHAKTQEPSETDDVPVMTEELIEPNIDYTVDNVETRELIRMLASLNYLSDSTPITTEQVKKAVYAFQKDQKMNPTGEIDITTLSTILNVYGLQRAQAFQGNS